jgi:hypothetical protein
VASHVEVHDDMRLRRIACSEASGRRIGDEKALIVVSLGVIFASLRWVCYYSKRVEAGNDPGEEWRRMHYERCLGCIRVGVLLIG